MRRIDFLVCIWPSQQEKLKYYGDLMLIDSTFGISLRGYRALNVVVVDQHFRSVLVATSFTVSEKVVAYKKTLGFINSVTQFKRLPLCLISDSAPQIHASVSDVYPYCRHIYCAFHLLKDLKLGRKKSSAPECGDSERDLKKDARSWVLSLFISSSQTNFDHALSELDKLLEDPQLGNTKDKVKKLMAHGVNGGRALQDVFTADSIASSRIESRNAALKRFGVGASLSLLDCLLSLKDMVKSQEYNDIVGQDKEYKFMADGVFLGLHEKDALIGVTCEVLEKMYNEHNLGMVENTK